MLTVVAVMVSEAGAELAVVVGGGMGMLVVEGEVWGGCWLGVVILEPAYWLLSLLHPS